MTSLCSCVDLRTKILLNLLEFHFSVSPRQFIVYLCYKFSPISDLGIKFPNVPLINFGQIFLTELLVNKFKMFLVERLKILSFHRKPAPNGTASARRVESSSRPGGAGHGDDGD